MKKILFLLLFCGFWANAQQYHDKGAKFENATNEGDTITVNTRIPIIDEFGLINYYVDVADLLALNPAPVLEWGNITGTLSNQTDLQGALNAKADQSALTAHTSNGNIHFTQSAISITESQVSDLKDYLRGDVNDTNGANKLTLGSLEVVGQTTLQNGLNLISIPTGTSNNILTINGTGDVEQRVFSLGDIDIANAAGTSQFPVGLGDQLRIQGSGDTSISFDGITNTININSTPGSGGGGAVTSFNGRTGGVVSQAGDYSTAMVNENTNLYFTEARVRGTDLSGLTVANTPISSTNTFIQALGRLQGQINDRITGSYTGFDSRYVNVGGDNMTGDLSLSPNVFLRFASNSMTFGSTTSANIINLINNDLQILDNGTVKYKFEKANGNFVASGRLTGTGFNPLKGIGSGVGDANAAWVGLYESNGAVRQGFLGFGSEFNSELSIRNDRANSTLNLASSGGVSGLTYNYGSGSKIVWHSGNLTPSDYELTFTKNTGFNKNFGTTAGTVAQGNDSRINNGQTAFSWGNHALAGYATTTFTDARYLRKDITTRKTGGYLDFDDNVYLRLGSTPKANLGYNGATALMNLIGSNFVILDDGVTKFSFFPTTGNFNATGEITGSNLSGTNTGDQTLSGLGGVPTSRTITAGSGLTGGGNLSANRTLSVDATVARMNATNTGSLTVTGDVIANSDKRLKKNIKRIDNALAIVQLLGGYEYDRKDVDLHQAGVIAQEVEEVFPTAVSEDEKGIKSVAYNQLIALLIEAVKEQQIEIENLKTLINEK